MVSNSYILNFVKEYNDFSDSNIFDKKLNLLINAEIGKLANSGVPNIFVETTEQCDAYCLCIARAIAISMNADVDFEMYNSLYQTSVNDLRCSLLQKSN